MAGYTPTSAGVLVPANFAAPKRPERREIATTRDGRDITRGYLDPLMLQQPQDGVLQLRGGGDYLIYKELLRDDQVGSTFQQRRLAVVSKEWDVEPGGKSKADKAAAEHMKEQLNELGWDRVTEKMLFGIFYGFAVAEALWARDGRHVTIKDIKVRERRRFGFDGLGRLRLRTMTDTNGELLPDRKFWAYSTGADNDDEPYGLGLAHWLYWPAFFKKAGLQYWLVFLERFGQPTAKGEYPQNAGPAEQQKLLDALEAINTDTGIIIPQGMTIGLLEAARSGTADYAVLYEKMNDAIAKMVLGQTASSQGTPGRLGNDDLQGDVRQDLIKADADLVCESFNRSIGRWLTEWNYPGAAYPRVYRKVELDEDLAKRAERDSNIKGMGFKPTVGYITETYGGEWEEDTPVPPLGKPATQPTNKGEEGEQLEGDAVPAVAGAESVQQTALNGAQIKSLSDIIARVQAKGLAVERARALIEAGFPAIEAEQIDRLIGGPNFAAGDPTPPEQMLSQTRDRLEPATNAWINSIRALADEVDTLEELQDRLLELYPTMTLDDYANAMTDVQLAAMLAGRNEVEEER